MPKAEIITSPANPLLKDIRRAVLRGSLTAEGLCIAETFHLLDEALRSEREIRVVLAADTARPTVEQHVRRLRDVRLAVLPDGLFQTIAATETSQGVMALVAPPAWSLDQLFTGTALVMVLDGLQEPGNAGAICRAAEAFGATGVLFLKGTASPFNPKTLRASAGSLFRLPFAHGVGPAPAHAALARAGLDLWAGVPAGQPGAQPLGHADFTRPCAFVIGSEGRGVSPELRAEARDLFIPTQGVESLNAAVAAGILLYEARRQRGVLP